MENNRLSISRTALLTLHFCGKNVTSLVLFSVQALALSISISALFSWAVDNPNERATILVGSTLAAFAWCPVMIAVNRRILLDEPLSPLSYFYSIFEIRTLRYYAYTVSFIAILFGAVFSASGFNSYATLFAFLIFATILFRLSFVFPALAVDEYESLEQSFRLLLGSAWRLFQTLALISVPIVLIHVTSMYVLPVWSNLIVTMVLASILGLVNSAAVSYAYSFCKRRTDSE